MVTAANMPSVGVALATVIVMVVVVELYLPESVGARVAVMVAVPALPTSIVVPDTDATVASDDEYVIAPATDAVGAVTVKSTSPNVFDTLANPDSVVDAFDTVMVRVTDVAAS